MVDLINLHFFQVERELPIVEKRKESTKFSVKSNSKNEKPAKGRSKENPIESRALQKAANKILELGVFVDTAACQLFLPYLGKGETSKEKIYIKLRELVLAFVNGVID